MYKDKVISREYDEEREKNVDIINKYFELEGDNILDAWKLYHDQAYTGVYTTETGKPEGVGGGIENIKEWYAYNVKYFPNWKHNSVTIFQKEDPSKMVVLEMGEGDIDLPDYPKSHVSTQIFHEFTFAEGEITLHLVYLNPSVFIDALGMGDQIHVLEYPIKVRTPGLFQQESLGTSPDV